MSDVETPTQLPGAEGEVAVIVGKEPTSLIKLPSSKPMTGEDWDDEVSESDGPPEVQRRVKALKKLQVDVAHTESAFFREMHDLEMKYANQYQDFFEKRREIVLGKYEPTDEECKFSCGGDDDVAEVEGAAAKAKKVAGDGSGPDVNLNEAVNTLKLDDKTKSGEEVISGIPDFWLTIFQNVEMLSEMIHEHDLPILKHLTDIKVEMMTKPMGFKIFFHFSPNEYFTDSVLTKTYEMKCEVDHEDPFSFEGPEIIKCAGCIINWNEGKNVTVRVVRKKQKHKQTGSVRMISKNVEVPSFFEFFSPPTVEEGTEIDEDAQVKLTNHFEVGQYIRERIVPRAVLYYTGEALEDEDDDDDDDFDEEEEEEDDSDADNASGQSANAVEGD